MAKFLAVFLRGWSWAKANPAEARTLALDFYKQGGLEVTPKAMDQEFRLAADLQPRRAVEADGASLGGLHRRWLVLRNRQVHHRGWTIPSNPDAKSYVTDDFLKRVAADPKLKAFATEFDKK